jgi:hypothetical protein
MTDALATQIEAGFQAVGLRRGEAA